MGTVSRDIHRKGRDYDESYPYEAAGIAALLRDIYRLTESRIYDGDIDATAILIDLKMALDSNCLTPRMRQVVALYYFAQFTEEESAEVLEISQVTLNESLETALERIAAHMEYGYTKVTNAKSRGILPDSHGIKQWLNDVACGKELYEIDETITSDINIWRASKLKDERDLTAIKQRIEGPSYVLVYASTEQEYPALTWEQMKWKDRRMSYVSDMKYDDKHIKVGFRKTAILNEEDEWVYPRQRLFAKRN